MAKKYLLYIHDERFDSEPKKSELVNRLLAEHYSLPPLRDKPLGIPPVAKKHEVPDLEVVKELSRQQNNPRFTGAIASCKVHGLPLDSRGRCLQKGCKYS